MFDKTQPLWLPKGSVRALIAGSVTIGFIFGMVTLEVFMVVLTFYFGSRHRQSSASETTP